ncbi:nucleotide exchange factor GrpE [Streptosporangium sp. KLBMP 9127]|nr:nucleotide exchange factor GrpE [Streptosporangium sp. KLBMP 9127]
MSGRPDVPGSAGEGAGAEPQTAQGDAGESTDAKLAELEDRWLRTAAELENVRKRIVKDTERSRAEERGRVTAAWLPVLDNLELALQHAGDDSGAVIAGVRAVRDQAVDVLARLGYTRHAESGVPFDPARHEAVATVERDDVAPGTVVEVLRPGYGEDSAQLRPAVVVVAKEAE